MASKAFTRRSMHVCNRFTICLAILSWASGERDARDSIDGYNKVYRREETVPWNAEITRDHE